MLNVYSPADLRLTGTDGCPVRNLEGVAKRLARAEYEKCV